MQGDEQAGDWHTTCLHAPSRVCPPQAQMGAKALRKAAQEAEERASQEAARAAEAERAARVQAVLGAGVRPQWHGLRKHEW